MMWLESCARSAFCRRSSDVLREIDPYDNKPNRPTDSAQLEALGYDSKFDRSMSLWSNFALGFTYLSPVVGVYTVFAFAIVTGGPPMFWSYLFVGLGQLLVAWYSERLSRSFRLRAVSIRGRGGWWESVGLGWRAGSTCGPCSPPLPQWRWEGLLM